MGIQAACTIVSKNYLAFARVLARSFLEHHPDARFFVLIVDRIEGEFDPAEEPFTTIQVEELAGIGDIPPFLFQYTQLEANTAAKPFFLEHLLERYELGNLLYLDPDIEVFKHFDSLEPALEQHSIVVVPHLTAPIEDGHKPTEVDILLAGSYNLGFLGLKHTDTTRRFLRWWQERLHDRCIVAHERGLFVDQKWIDLVPGMFKDVFILTEPGYDVAYWNLHERTVTAGPPPRVNGEPLYFYHYSGIKLDELEQVSKHQTRFLLSDLGELGQFYRNYRDLVLAAGHRTCIRWPYAFATFDDGRPIEDAVRRHYLELGKRRERFGNPFHAGPDSFVASLEQPAPAAGAPQAEAPAAAPNGGAPARTGASGWLFQRVGRVYHSTPGRGARRFARRVLGPDRTLKVWKLGHDVRQRALGAPAPVAPAPVAPARAGAPVAGTPGITIIGYLTAETGMGEVARSLAAAARARSVPIDRHNVQLNVRARQQDEREGDVQSDFQRAINLVCVNADQVPAVVEHIGPEAFAGHYNVGLWLWELSTFPERWLPSFEPFDEIWTPSRFCADAISAISPVPVRRMPLPVRTPAGGGFERAHFGLPEDAFLFVFAFDFLSLWERKNPIAALRAFRQAFRDDDRAQLVLKTTNSEFDQSGRALIEREAEGLPITWIDRYLSRAETDDLFRCCDAYVSLHRSEGYGLTLAESMALGKPVIATDYSGNEDFFGVNNGFPVRYRLVELERDVGPYEAGCVWAEPEVEHAAHQLRLVFEDADERAARAARGREDVTTTLSPAAVGALLERRHRDIQRRLAARAAR